MNQQEEEILLERIKINPAIMGGKPIIRGMRFPVADILEMLTNGMNEEEILEQHPILEKEDIKAALLYATVSVKNKRIIHAA